MPGLTKGIQKNIQKGSHARHGSRLELLDGEGGIVTQLNLHNEMKGGCSQHTTKIKSF